MTELEQLRAVIADAKAAAYNSTPGRTEDNHRDTLYQQIELLVTRYKRKVDRLLDLRIVQIAQLHESRDALRAAFNEQAKKTVSLEEEARNKHGRSGMCCELRRQANARADKRLPEIERLKKLIDERNVGLQRLLDISNEIGQILVEITLPD